MTTPPELNRSTPVLGRTSFSQESTAKPAKAKAITCVASASHGDISMILQAAGGIFSLILMWGTNIPENAGNPSEGAFIESGDGFTYAELDWRAFDEPSILRKGDNWKVEVEVCDVFTEFIFTPHGHEPTTLSVSMDILRALGANTEKAKVSGPLSGRGDIVALLIA